MFFISVFRTLMSKAWQQKLLNMVENKECRYVNIILGKNPIAWSIVRIPLEISSRFTPIAMN